ncbi:hypothetical protein [Streptomyces sp. NPDC059819]|uniref:hypothetical protein n=1 Tax=Streptomyces sp. NPDC059819 TaxID=3346963 RepID=UPI0036499C27
MVRSDADSTRRNTRNTKNTKNTRKWTALANTTESTARPPGLRPRDHGHHVLLATDAMTDPDAEANRHSVGRIFPTLGETTTTVETIGMLGATR